MPDNTISIQVKGLDRVLNALDKFPNQVEKYIAQAGDEASNNLLDIVGLQNYPPEGPWNKAPEPFYIRTFGTQTKHGNLFNSQNLGKGWTTITKGVSTIIGNKVSYAKYLHGENQVYWAESHGWKKLYSTAKEHLNDITRTYQAWINKLIHDLGL